MAKTAGMPTTGAMYANSRDHNEDGDVDGDKKAAFMDHTVATTSMEPTHVPVHDRIRSNF